MDLVSQNFFHIVPNTKHLIKIIWDIIRDLIRDTFWRRVKSGQFLYAKGEIWKCNSYKIWENFETGSLV